MLKTRKILALLTSACMLAAVSLTSCSGGSDDDGTETSTYSGTYTVNGASYNSLTLSGTADSGTATLTGSGGTQSGTYARSTGASVRALSLSGSYTLTFSGNTVSISFSGNNITLSAGTWSASGTGTLVVPVSSGSSGSGGSCIGGERTQEERAIHSSLVGTTRWGKPLAERTYEMHYKCKELTINADGSGTLTPYYEDKNGTRINTESLTESERSSIESGSQTFIHSYIKKLINNEVGDWHLLTCYVHGGGAHGSGYEGSDAGFFSDTDGDGVLDKDGSNRRLN